MADVRQQQLMAFRETFKPGRPSVYYPFCGDDPLPWEVFEDGTILGVDSNRYSIRRLQKAGLGPVAVADVTESMPDEEFDILLLLGWRWENAMLEMAGQVKQGGYVVTNSFPAAGGLLGQYKPQLELVGQIDADAQPETSSVAGGEFTPLGMLRHIVNRHSTRQSIGTLAYEVELTHPQFYSGSLLVMQWAA